jgi:hypothetical protein
LAWTLSLPIMTGANQPYTQIRESIDLGGHYRDTSRQDAGYQDTTYDSGRLSRTGTDIMGPQRTWSEQTLLNHNKKNGDGPEEKPEPFLEPNIFKGLWNFTWLIHLAALGCTASAVQLTFRNYYWADEGEWKRRHFLFLQGQQNQDALQFVAKLYEIILVMSLSAMVMHFMRRMIIGDGIQWGLMSGSYQVGSPTYLFSRELWSPLVKPMNSPNLTMALMLAFLVIYANVIGPFTAVIIMPNLDWWPLADPFGGQDLTTYIRNTPEGMYPSVLNKDNIPADCEEFASSYCPDTGVPSVKVLLETWLMQRIEPVTEIQTAGVGNARQLASSLEYSTDTEHLSVATTHHASTVDLIGSFWNYVNSMDTGAINKRDRRPRLRPTEDNTFAPLVQVQCNPFSYNDWEATGKRPKFLTSRMRDLSSYYVEDRADRYMGRNEWELSEDFMKDYNETFYVDYPFVESPVFHWVDVAEMFPDMKASLGAIITVPMTDNVSHEEPMQDWVTMPCAIDARWAGAAIEYDPVVDKLVPNNLTDLEYLANFWGDPKKKLPPPRGSFKPTMSIGTDWADTINLRTGNFTVVGDSGEPYDAPAMEWLLYTFIDAMLLESTDEDGTFDYHSFASFKTPNFTADASRDELYQQTARTAATTLALHVAEGLARVTYTSTLDLVTKDNGDGTVQWANLFRQVINLAEANAGEVETQPAAVFEGMQRYKWKVDRYGWGYGWRAPTVKAGIIMMMLHVAAVVAFGCYILWFRLVAHGWSTGAWGGFGELIALALVSIRPENQELARKLAMAEDRMGTLRTKVVVRAPDGNSLDLLLDEEKPGTRLVRGKTYD